MGSSSRPARIRPAKMPLLLAGATAFALAFGGDLQAPRAESPLAACAAVTAVSSDAAATAPRAIHVTVDNVRNSKGLITAVLYNDDPDTFLKRGAKLDRIRVEAHEGKTELCLKAPAAGRYSVALYHDENGNKEFDRDFLGIPTEGYGFSRNPGFRFGKPDLEETLFSTDGDPTNLRISILYLQG